MKKQKKVIHIGKDTLSTPDVAAIAHRLASLRLDKTTLLNLQKTADFLRKQSATELVYGVNTGFGPMADTYVAPKKQSELQYNLIRSHAAGQGNPLPTELVRAMMVVRLHTLAKDRSGASPEALRKLKQLLEKDIVPVVFEHGSVGASGDLVQLAHIALAMIGEGNVYANGTSITTRQALKRNRLSPARLRGRDGLALINGTSAMTGIAAMNIEGARQLVRIATTAAALLLELIEAPRESLHPLLSDVRPHPGQKEALRMMRSALVGSRLLKRTIRRPLPKLNAQDETAALGAPLQQYYSIRCTPQIIGPIIDTIEHAATVVETEINAVTDNPIVSRKHGIIHGGNFHGDYVALEMDKLKIAVTKLSLLMERQLNVLLNPRLNRRLPPFLNRGIPGFHLGLQGFQFVATSNAAENQTLSMPMSIHTIPTNNDNQDIVSMGANAALLAGNVIENTYQVGAVLLIALSQAVSILGVAEKLGRGTRALHQSVSSVFPGTNDDTFQQKEIAALAKLLKQRGILDHTVNS